MFQGKSIQELAATVEEHESMKRDFVADTRTLRFQPVMQKLEEPQQDRQGREVAFLPEPGKIELICRGVDDGNDATFDLTSHCHGQIAQRVKIPKPYYDRCLSEAPTLLTAQVNHWFAEQPEVRMIRTLGDTARAFLSNRYRRIDAYQVLQWLLPVVAEMQSLGATIQSCDLTDQKLYVKVFLDSLTAEINKRSSKVGDVVRGGFQFGTSEIGMGSFFSEPMIEVLACTNGMVMPDSGIRRRHVGRRTGPGSSGEPVELFSDETLQADDEALMLKARDTLKAVIDETKFRSMVEQFQQAAENRIEGDPVATVELTQEQLRLTDDERGGILRHLIDGGDLSQWGLANAITRASQDAGNYDRASEMERMGGQIIELGPTEWKRLATGETGKGKKAKPIN